MDAREILTDLYGRIAGLVPEVVGGLSEADLARRREGVGGAENSIAWLVWHSARLQDASLSALAGPELAEQVWTGRGWAERFALDRPGEESGTQGAADTADTAGTAGTGVGYGDTSAQVDAVRAPADLLTGYHAEVADRVAQVLAALGPADLDRVVDEAFDPPVTVGVRLVSVAADCLQHLGHAAGLRGTITG